MGKSLQDIDKEIRVADLHLFKVVGAWDKGQAASFRRALQDLRTILDETEACFQKQIWAEAKD